MEHTKFSVKTLAERREGKKEDARRGGEEGRRERRRKGRSVKDRRLARVGKEEIREDRE